jgi:hypothetical protein
MIESGEMPTGFRLIAMYCSRLRKTIGFVLAFIGLSSSPAFAQKSDVSPAVPDTASVVFQKELKIHIGQPFTFQLVLHPTPLLHPNGIQSEYRRRNVTALFRRVGGSGKDSYGDDVIGVAAAELLDGESKYNMSVNLPPAALPGQWKLSSVTINWNGSLSLRIPDNVSFELLAPESISFRIHAPPSVEAGRKYVFTLTIDKQTSDWHSACAPQFSAALGPEGRPFLSFDQETADPESLTFSFSHLFEPDDRTGTWEVVVSEHDGFGWDPCPKRQLFGEDKFAFTVEPPTGIRIPETAAVTVNPAQILLLEGEVDRLTAEASQIRSAIASNSLTQAELREKLRTASDALTATQAKYLQHEDPGSSFASQINVFFGDIRRTYENADMSLKQISRLEQAATYPKLEYVSNASLNNSPTAPNSASAVVLAAIQRNVSAYKIVVTTKHLTFNLEVYSEPQGATIYYHSATEDHETKLAHITDWPIENLTRAYYYFRCHMDGYDDLRQEFDGADDTRTRIIFRFPPKADRK